MQPASTTALTSTLRVISSTRNDIVSGPPTTATPSVAMPVSMATSGSSAKLGLTSSRTEAKNFPIRLPTNSEAKNRPPRKPEASEIRQAVSFSAMIRAIRPIVISWWRSRTIAPWPAASTCGVTIAMPPTMRPPNTGLSQTGSQSRANSRSNIGELRITAMPTPPVIRASTTSARYCFSPTALTCGTSSEYGAPRSHCAVKAPASEAARIGAALPTA